MEREIIVNELRKMQYLTTMDAQSGRYREIPEYQIVSFIFMNESVTTDQIEQKYPDLPSIPLLLSNLQNDGLIGQSPQNYRWEISSELQEKINQTIATVAPLQNAEKGDKDAAMQEIRRRELNQLAQILEKKGVRIDWTRGNLLNLPEVEVVYKLWKNGEMSTDQLERMIVSTDSISLILSNLQADRLIEQTSNYNWKLNSSLLDELGENVSILSEERSSPPPSKGSEIVEENRNLSDLATLTEKAKLLKVLKSHPAFATQKPEELIRGDTFKVLQVVMENQPISTEKIVEFAGDDVPISLLLSNLAADGLIKADESSYSWQLNEELSIKLRKTVVEQADLDFASQLMNQSPEPEGAEIPDEAPESETQEMVEEIGAPPASSDPIGVSTVPEEITSSQIDEPPEEETSPSLPDKSIEEPLEKKLMKALDEIGKPLDPGSGEFHILLQLCQHGALSGEQIERLVEVPVSVSLSLSNLVADGLAIEESYLYELAPPLKEILERKSEPEEIIVEAEPAESLEGVAESPKVNEEEVAFNNALRKLGYIKEETPSEENVSYAIIKTIRDHPLIDQKGIKQRNPSISPVLITRTLTQLEIDGVIEQKTDDSWQLTQKISSILNEDERKVKEKAEEERRRRELAERETKFAENRDRLERIFRSLITDGLIPANDPFQIEQLMQRPPFEILAHMNLFGLTSLTDIKQKMTSASPVIISRTIIQLQEKGYLTEEDPEVFSLTEKGRGEA